MDITAQCSIMDRGNSMINSFLTIEKECGPEIFKEKGSKFLGYAYPLSTADEAEEILVKLRKQYHDSTHVCYAYRLGKGEEEYFRHNDDGEPSGTAGMPIYNEIKGKDLFNLLVAVVRYYGGTKLGTGGLIRAYGESAKMALNASKIKNITIMERHSLSFPFSFIGEFMNLVNNFDIKIINQIYSEASVMIEFEIPIDKLSSFSAQLQEKSAGKLSIQQNM